VPAAKAVLNPRQIEAFRAVMLMGRMTTAAELLGVTQPAISRLVRDLEASLDLLLFERRGNQLVPTPDATTLYGEVERSFVGLKRIAEVAGDIHARRAGSLRIMALPALASGFLPRFVGRFVADRSNLALHINGMPSHLVIDAVAAGQCDLGLAAAPVGARAGVDVMPLTADAVAILPARHHLAGANEIVAADFEGERFISLGKSSIFGERIDAAFEGVRRRLLVEAPLAQIACVLVSEGVGVSIVDPFSASEFEQRGVVIRPFRPRIDVGITMLKATHRPLSALAREFADAFLCHVRGFISARRNASAGRVRTAKPTGSRVNASRR
jgi:DNA-binding transcriptional LysR family regulator